MEAPPMNEKNSRKPRAGGPGSTALLTSCGLVLGALLLLPGLGSMDAVWSTDARYLEIGREMFVSGQLGMPTLAGAPHLDKPPLAYWAAAAGYALFGVGPFGGRFFEQLALLGTSLVVLAFGRRWLPTGAAFLSAAVLSTSLLPFATSRGLSTDLFQLFFYTGALLALLEASRGSHPARLLLLASTLLGASMLAKGPIALLVLGCVWLPYRLLGGPRLAVGGRTRALAIGVFCVVAAPWYLWLLHDHFPLLEYLVRDQLVGRLGAGGLGHRHGPLYPLGAWLWGTLPWSPLLAVALVRLRPARARARRDPVDLLLWLGAVVPVLLFSIPATKLPTYILPAFPPAALLLAGAASRDALAGPGARLATRAGFAIPVILAAAVAAILLRPVLPDRLAQRVDLEALRGGAVLATVLLAVAVAGVVQAVRTRNRVVDARRLLGLAATTAAVLALGFTALAPAFRSDRKPGELAARIPGARVVQVGTFQPSLLFYFGSVERTRVADFPGLEEGDLTSRPELELTREDAVALMREALPTLALVKRREDPEVLARIGGETLWCDRKHCLVANAAATQRLADSHESGGPDADRSLRGRDG